MANMYVPIVPVNTLRQTIWFPMPKHGIQLLEVVGQILLPPMPKQGIQVVRQIAGLVHVAQPCKCRIYTTEAPSRLILSLIDLKVYRLLIDQL